MVLPALPRLKQQPRVAGISKLLGREVEAPLNVRPIIEPNIAYEQLFIRANERLVKIALVVRFASEPRMSESSSTAIFFIAEVERRFAERYATGELFHRDSLFTGKRSSRESARFPD